MVYKEGGAGRGGGGLLDKIFSSDGLPSSWVGIIECVALSNSGVVSNYLTAIQTKIYKGLY